MLNCIIYFLIISNMAFIFNLAFGGGHILIGLYLPDHLQLLYY